MSSYNPAVKLYFHRNLYRQQDKLVKAERVYTGVLGGMVDAFGPEHTFILHVVCSLGHLYYNQGKPFEAKAMLRRVSVGYMKEYRSEYTFTRHALGYIVNFDKLCRRQGKFVEDEERFLRLVASYEKLLAPEDVLTGIQLKLDGICMEFPDASRFEYNLSSLLSLRRYSWSFWNCGDACHGGHVRWDRSACGQTSRRRFSCVAGWFAVPCC